MSRYRVVISREVRDVIAHLPPELKRKVKAAIRSLAQDPHRAKELKEDLAGLRSYRIARVRLILRVRGEMVELVAFGPRRDVYERAAAELSAAIRKSKRARKY
jgi:mRNA-degrading endonuclease RelE of RelBE toxin-antitoxin system